MRIVSNGVVVADTARQWSDILVKMAKRGIACNVHYKPLSMHTAYKNLGYDIDISPVHMPTIVKEYIV